ncbi:hypothetical protein ElyMa_004290500 [Elysia marginata]|uniref:Uncharacterized protein n=1 Tax=Elysia marginata TaxID=1093978 RepID=A0AAV4GVE2_9GAST|nr:hypothetical protein ElyMa_004290500 [Elysia marginata]
MLSFLTLAVLVAGAWSLPMTTMSMGMMDTGMMNMGMMSTMTPPKPCCIPPQWQGVLVDLKAKYDVVSTVVYDSGKQMQGTWTTMRTTGQVVAHSLIDYSKVRMRNTHHLEYRL